MRTWNWIRLPGSITVQSLTGKLNEQLPLLALALKEMQAQQSGVATIAAGDTTPSVYSAGVFVTANTGSTSITTFDDGSAGRSIVLVFADANTTLVNGSTLKLNGGANYTGAAGNVMQFVTDDGSIWREKSQPIRFSE